MINRVAHLCDLMYYCIVTVLVLVKREREGIIGHEKPFLFCFEGPFCDPHSLSPHEHMNPKTH